MLCDAALRCHALFCEMQKKKKKKKKKRERVFGVAGPLSYCFEGIVCQRDLMSSVSAKKEEMICKNSAVSYLGFNHLTRTQWKQWVRNEKKLQVVLFSLYTCIFSL